MILLDPLTARRKTLHFTTFYHSFHQKIHRTIHRTTHRTIQNELTGQPGKLQIILVFSRHKILLSMTEKTRGSRFPRPEIEISAVGRSQNRNLDIPILKNGTVIKICAQNLIHTFFCCFYTKMCFFL